MAKVIEVTGCQTCPYKTEYNKCGYPAAYEHRDEHKLLPTDGSIADFCSLPDKDDYLESEFDPDIEPGDIPDYVPETGDRVYTKKDFIEIAKGNKQYAKILRSRCTWQHPETLVDEDLIEGEIIEMDGTYLLTGGNDEEFEDDNPKDGPTMPPPFMFNDQAETEGWIIACESERRTKAFYFIDTDSVDFPNKSVALKYVVKQALRMPKGIHAEALIYLSKYSPEYISTTVKETVGEIAFAELKEVLRYTEFDKIQF